MSKKSHSGLKRALAWMLTVAMMAQGCIVYADDFTSEPDAAVVEEAAVSEDVDTSADSDPEFADEGEDTSTEAKKMRLFLTVQKQLEMIPMIPVLMNLEKVT